MTQKSPNIWATSDIKFYPHNRSKIAQSGHTASERKCVPLRACVRERGIARRDDIGMSVCNFLCVLRILQSALCRRPTSGCETERDRNDEGRIRADTESDKKCTKVGVHR